VFARFAPVTCTKKPELVVFCRPLGFIKGTDTKNKSTGYDAKKNLVAPGAGMAESWAILSGLGGTT